MSSGYKFSTSSYDRMAGVRPELVAIASRALDISPVDFGVTEGVRTKEKQEQLYADGKSQTMNSRHLTGHALDVVAYVGGSVTWDWAYYEQIALAFKDAAKQLGIKIEWGGDWVSFRDGPHYQLPWESYPA